MLLQKFFQRFATLPHGERAKTLTREPFRRLRMARQYAAAGERSPVYGERGQAEGVPVMSERIEKRIGRRVAALARVSHDAGDG